ncbi:zinc-binding dehydrogenase [Sphingomonas endolithica]|uniref:zinc-binding dehydrogenase n=1 Tax=Sphingomonas endolithica TaxID=2972485 RepID=UPI0021AFE4F4|nr:zinc-binding dehydrogenase [Sphingomonas sp. ZFBP2030]
MLTSRSINHAHHLGSYPLGFQGNDTARELGITVSSTQVRSNGLQLAEAGRLLDDRTIHVTMGSTYPLAQASQAHERALNGGGHGKIVLTAL